MIGAMLSTPPAMPTFETLTAPPSRSSRRSVPPSPGRPGARRHRQRIQRLPADVSQHRNEKPVGRVDHHADIDGADGDQRVVRPDPIRLRTVEQRPADGLEEQVVERDLRPARRIHLGAKPQQRRHLGTPRQVEMRDVALGRRDTARHRQVLRRHRDPLARSGGRGHASPVPTAVRRAPPRHPPPLSGRAVRCRRSPDSIPASRAMRRASGVAIALPCRRYGCGAPLPHSCGAARYPEPALPPPFHPPRCRPCPCRSSVPAACRRAPSRRSRPGCSTISPSPGASISLAIFSVSTTNITSPACTRSPGRDMPFREHALGHRQAQLGHDQLRDRGASHVILRGNRPAASPGTPCSPRAHPRLSSTSPIIACSCAQRGWQRHVGAVAQRALQQLQHQRRLVRDRLGQLHRLVHQARPSGRRG